MTERDWWMQVVGCIPEDKKLTTDSLENMGVKELRDYTRRCYAALNIGELTEQFKEWIIESEPTYDEEIGRIIALGKHKVQLTYYGMVYKILEYSGCYLRGKNSSPIGITHSRYCTELKLNNRLRSNNVRKTISNSLYGHDFPLIIAKRKKGESLPYIYPKLVELEPLYSKLADEISKRFFSID